jgi:hypothetical protein
MREHWIEGPLKDNGDRSDTARAMFPPDDQCPSCGSDVLAVQGVRESGTWIVRVVCRTCLSMWTPVSANQASDPSAA